MGTPLAWVLVATATLTSLLTLYAVAKVWNRAFWGKPQDAGAVDPDDEDEDDADESDESPGVALPPRMVGATIGLIGLGVALAAFAGPLYDYAERAAAALPGPSYVSAVLEGVPTP